MSWDEFDEMPYDDGGRKRAFEGDDWTENKRRAVQQEVDIGPETQHANGASVTTGPSQLFSSDHGGESASTYNPPLTYDTCFGVVAVQTTLDKPTPKLDGLSLEVRTCENIVKFYKDDDEFVALIISDGLASLSRRVSVHMTATLVPETCKANETRIQKQLTNGRQARIVIHGLYKDKDLIRRHLSTAELYLQHPTLDEYDQSVGYFNPHLLLRPGAEMPRVQDLSLENDEEEQSQQIGSAVLDEVAQGKIWRIFDLASGGEVRPQIAPSLRLKSTLQEHQRVALEVMLERELGAIEDAKFSTLWKRSDSTKDKRFRNRVTGWFEKSPASLCGGILADEMGLGKTLSILALICWYLDARDSGMAIGTKGCFATLVVVPKSILIGWESQIKRHIIEGGVKVTTYHGPSRYDEINEVMGHDIVLTTYEVLRQDFTTKHERQTLYSHRWCRIVLDEAHRIRSRSSQIFEAAVAMSKLSQNRWCLTGTPIHNSLDNYGALISFLQVPALQEKKIFDKFISKPFKLKERDALERLQALVQATSLRRTMKLNGASVGLQPVSERVTLVEMSANDIEVYRFFQEKSFQIARRIQKEKGSRKKKRLGDADGSNILPLILFLRFICNYGQRLLPKSALEAWNARNMKAADESMIQQLQRSCAKCNTSLKHDDDAETLLCGHRICSSCSAITEERSVYGEVTNDECYRCQRRPELEELEDSTWSRSTRSTKVQALIDNLRRERDYHLDGTKQKSVIFSCWTKMLDCVQKDLEQESFNLERIDGQASLEQRRKAIYRFQEDSDYTIMLASIGSAGEGIDLISACHVHILEPQWNPMSELQAIGRVHRFGQTQRVTVTRYIVQRSIETYVQWIQAEKLRLISESIDHDSVTQTEVDEVRWKKLQDTLSFGTQ